MNEVFRFNKRAVRTMEVDGEPLFCGKDVCRCISLNQSQLRRLDDDEKGLHLTHTLKGGEQKLLFINEPGLYSLILRSRKPEAKAFKRWVTHDVLPQIRKTGTYSQKPAEPPSRLQLAKMVIDLEEENQKLQAPAQYGQELMSTDDLFSITQVAKPLGISGQELNKRLHGRGVIFQQSGQWMPYSKYQSLGYFKIIAHVANGGTYHQLKVTAKGRQFIHGLLALQLTA